MNYIELNISFVSDNEVQKEIIVADLADMGFESFVEEEKLIKAYINENLYIPNEINDYLNQYQDITSEAKIIKQQNWNAEWENDYKPIIIQDKCIVKASFHQIEKKYPIEIIIDPKMSFGTGHHETTSLMLEEMFKLDFKDKTVLDMGTGTGILAILASILGAKEVTAIDIDEWSYENSIENTEKNGVSNVKVILGDASSIPSKKYDIILANINRNILLNDLKFYKQHLANTSIILLSGIYSKDFEIINKEAKNNNLDFVCQNENNNWITIRYNNA
jgi:ribosomal protein L11 methyltransferase